MTPSEYQQLAELMVRKIGEIQSDLSDIKGRMSALEVGFEELRHQQRLAFEAIQANGVAIERNRLAILANAEGIERNRLAILANAEGIERNRLAILANAEGIERNRLAILANAEGIERNHIAIVANAQGIERNGLAIQVARDAIDLTQADVRGNGVRLGRVERTLRIVS